jgi:phosphoglucomutase
MITASHNPIEDNGLKMVDPDGGMMSQEWEKVLCRAALCAVCCAASASRQCCGVACCASCVSAACVRAGERA